MRNLCLCFGVFALCFKISTAGLCWKDGPYYGDEITNCTREQFNPLCSGIVNCQDHAKESFVIVARYTDDHGQEIFCEFPRILEGGDFVKCDEGILQSNYYRCPKDRTIFASRFAFCDINTCNDCPGQSILAAGIGVGFKCSDLRRSCHVPQPLLYDNVPDCPSREDICFTPEDQKLIYYNENLRSTLKTKETCFRCRDGSMLISRKSVCDRIIDCSDLSDECLHCRLEPAVCKKMVRPSSSPTSLCQLGQIDCGDGVCVHRSAVCDGEIQCPSKADERIEFCGITLLCSDTVDSQQCRCDQDCTYTIGNACNETDIDCHANVFELENVNQDYTCSREQSETPISCSSIRGNSTPPALCNGIAECEHTDDDEPSSCDRFVCTERGNVTYSVLPSTVCDYTLDCEDGSDEMNCSNRFYCHSGDVKFVRISQVKNGRIDCSDASDECVEDNSTNSYIFHSKNQLLGNKVLYGVVWVMAILAITGNLIVAKQQVKTLQKTHFKRNGLSSLRANHILILNLAVSDFLMGIYLVGVGIAYEQLKGSYCTKELVWRSSTACTWMAVTSLISSETSVLTMVVLTSFRLYAILKPFRTSSHPPSWLVFFLSGAVWVVATIIAIFPLTPVFRAQTPDKALLPDNPFIDGIVSFEDGKKFLIQSLVFYPHENAAVLNELTSQAQSAKTWDDITAINNMLKVQQSDLHIGARFGFYNTHSICIADFFARLDDEYVGFSLFLNMFNFIAFAYIATAYTAIYFLSFSSSATKDDSSDAARMQMKIFRLVLTDFLTWIPICILAFIKLSDTNETLISGDVYAAAAVILLPINSALNPVVYSNTIPIIFRSTATLFEKLKKNNRLERTATKTFATKSTADVL